jgi:hypothetical protein
MNIPDSDIQWTNRLHGDTSPDLLGNRRAQPSVATRERLHLRCESLSPESRSRAEEESTSQKISLNDDDGHKYQRRSRRRRRVKGNQSLPKGILKKTASCGGLLDLDDNSSTDTEGKSAPKKRVSWSGLSSCRWDSQSAMSQSLKLPCSIRRSDSTEDKQSNEVWKSVDNASTSLESLCLRSRKNNASQHRRQASYENLFQNRKCNSI